MYLVYNGYILQKKMGRNHSELTKLACLNICDGFSHIMSHCYPTTFAGIVHPQYKVGCRIGACKNPLTSHKVFEAKSLEKKWMVDELTKTIMHMTVKSINNDL